MLQIMILKEFIEVLSRAPQDAEIYCEDYYSCLYPLGSIWLHKEYNRLIVSEYFHGLDDVHPSLYVRSNSEISFYEKNTHEIQD